MKTLVQFASGLALSGLMVIGMSSDASAQRGFHGGGGHVSVGVSVARSAVGIGFSRGVNALAVTARPGYYGGFYGGRYFFGYPSVGFRLGFLPFGYFPFYFGADLYYYNSGVFYRPNDNGGYEVASPPIGAAVTKLPEGAQSIVIDGQQYFEFNGVYFKPDTDDKGKTVYVVTGKDGVLNTSADQADTPPAPKVGDIVNELPEGSHKINLNGQKYFVSPEGVYYQEYTDANNFKGYRIVSIPSDDDTEKQQ